MSRSNRVCIPGIICIENITFFIVLLCLAGFFYFILFSKNTSQKNSYSREKEQYGDKIVVNIPPQRNALDYRDVLLNPYAAPYYDQNDFSPTASLPDRAGGASNFRQIGILTPTNGSSENQILPLLGRPLDRSGQWNYYTISNQHNNVKIPVRIGAGSGKGCKGKGTVGKNVGKDGLSEYGVNELMDGNQVFLDGYDKDFKVKMYENANMPYTPF